MLHVFESLILHGLTIEDRLLFVSFDTDLFICKWILYTDITQKNRKFRNGITLMFQKNADSTSNGSCLH